MRERDARKVVSHKRSSQKTEPCPTTSSELTQEETASSADTKPKDYTREIKDQPPLEEPLCTGGDGMQEECERPEGTSSRQLTEKATVEEVVPSPNQQVIPEHDASAEHTKGQDNTDCPPPSPPSRPPRSSESITAVAVVTVAAFSQVSIGASLTWSHVLLPQLAMNTTTFLNTELYLSRSFANLAEYLLLAGLVMVLVPSGWVVTRLGRRRALLAATLASTGSWALHALATDALLLLLGRFFAGLSAAMLKVSATTYVTEVIVISARGQALVCLEMLKITGALICLGLSVLLPWYHIAFVNLVVMVGCWSAVLFFPESPAYLVLKEREEEAHDALKRLRDSDSNVQEELKIIKNLNPPEKANTKFSSLFRKPLISHMMTLVGLTVISVFSGSAVIMTGGGDMLLEAGMKGRQEIAIVIVLVSLVSGTIFLIATVDWTGRRFCLLVSLTMLVLIYSGLGTISYVASVTPGWELSATINATLPKVWVVVYICLILLAAFSLTLGTHTVPTVLAAEYFPAYCRPQGLAVFFTVSVLLQALSLHLQPLIEATLGLSGLYWLFGGMALLGIFYTNFRGGAGARQKHH